MPSISSNRSRRESASGKRPRILFAVDGTVDDDVADVDPLRTVFLGHRLGERPQARLGGIEGAIAGPAAQRGAGAGEQDGTSLLRDHVA
jgi:hypothetical protein